MILKLRIHDYLNWCAPGMQDSSSNPLSSPNCTLHSFLLFLDVLCLCLFLFLVCCLSRFCVFGCVCLCACLSTPGQVQWESLY